MTIVLFSCGTNNKESDKIISPSKKYYLTTTVNNEDKSKDDYADVVIHLYDSSGHLKSSINTNAGNFSKWAVDWNNKNDTVILYSSDIGPYAWKINQNSLEAIVMTDSLIIKAKGIKLKKYPVAANF